MAKDFWLFQNPSLHFFAVSQKCIHFAPLCCVFNVKKLEQKVEVYLTAQYIWQPVNIISTISAICLTRLLNFYNCLLLLWRPPWQVKRGDLRIIFKDNPRSAFFWLLTNKEAQFLTGPLVPDYHATLFFIWYQSILWLSAQQREIRFEHKVIHGICWYFISAKNFQLFGVSRSDKVV